jgi:dienelactone hydrolase
MRPANSVLIFALYVFIACACNQAETAPSVQPVKQLYINNIRSYLTDVATGITDSSMNDVHSLTEWEKLRDQRYQQFLEMLGIDDLMRKKRSDLHVTVTGTVQKKGYRIEKLYFESLPHLYVRANLYIPDSITTPRPAILYVSGHVYDQKGYYQAHPAKFAKLGFVCMITETIQMGEVRGEHWGLARNGWFNWISRGYNPNGVEVWNSIRALDVLTSRSEVDKDKIGITGISGGGSQSWYVSAADPRIKAVAPVCGASTLKEQVGKRLIDAQCDCMMLHNTYLRDFCDIGALIAPRPLLIAQANRDDIYTVEAVRELFNKVRKTYKAKVNTEFAGRMTIFTY